MWGCATVKHLAAIISNNAKIIVFHVTWLDTANAYHQVRVYISDHIKIIVEYSWSLFSYSIWLFGFSNSFECRCCEEICEFWLFDRIGYLDDMMIVEDA